MHNIYLGCKQPETYWIKEEIKKLKPKNKAFKGGWIFDHTLRCWHLCLAEEEFFDDFHKRNQPK